MFIHGKYRLIRVPQRRNLEPSFPLRVSSSDCRYETSEGGNDIYSCQTPYSLPASVFLFLFILSLVGSTLCSIFRTNKGLSSCHAGAMLGKGTRGCFFFCRVSFPGCYWPKPRSTHTKVHTVIDVSFWKHTGGRLPIL